MSNNTVGPKTDAQHFGDFLRNATYAGSARLASNSAERKATPAPGGVAATVTALWSKTKACEAEAHAARYIANDECGRQRELRLAYACQLEARARAYRNNVRELVETSAAYGGGGTKWHS